MGFKFKKGDTVQQVLPEPIKGEVVGYALDQTTGAVSAKVEWTDADGHAHSRFFSEDELAVVEVPADADSGAAVASQE